jgi:glycosyltransferase involved in cell wall biosynthesis
MAEPLKVLHCVAGNLFGGVETFLRTLAECREMSPGLASEYAVCFDGRLAAELRGAGAVVHHLGGVRFSRPWTVWQARGRLRELVRAGRFDVVVNHGCWPQMLFGPVARRTGRPVVYYMHEMIVEPGHWVVRGAARSVPDMVLVHSHCTAATLPRLYPRVWSEVIRYPVRARAVDRLEARTGVRAELATPETDVVVVTACRLEPWKGHRLLLSALGRLRDKPGWTAWVAGGVQRPQERAYLDELTASARDGGFDHRVRFLGHRGDVPRLLAAADIHCQSNAIPEPFGIAFIEALYAGLPVVSVRMGGAAEIVDDGCGVLVPPDDPGALAEALSALIDDPGTRARLGAAGPARAAALCAPEAVLPQLERLLNEVHDRRPVAGRGPLAQPVG